MGWIALYAYSTATGTSVDSATLLLSSIGGLSPPLLPIVLLQEVCHGIPSSRPLEEGDIAKFDVSVYFDLRGKFLA